MRLAGPLLSLVALATMVVVRSGTAGADPSRRPVLLFDASPAETAEQGRRVAGQLESLLEKNRHVKLVRRSGSGVFLPTEGRVDPAAPARAREAIALAREALARVALDEAERALIDAVAAFGVPATPEHFTEYFETQLQLASVLLEAQKHNSALQLFARTVVMAPDHDMDPDRHSPFVRAGFSDARATAALLPRGDLVVASDPPGAEVIVDGELRGYTPVSVDGLFAGEHVLALRQGESAPFARLVAVGAGISRVTVLLAPTTGEEPPESTAARLARSVDAELAIVLQASTAAARVRMVEADDGTTFPWRELPMDDTLYGSMVDEMLRPPAADRPPPLARGRPSRDPAWYEHWYVWAIGAAVVGGAIVTAASMSGDPEYDASVWFPPR